MPRRPSPPSGDADPGAAGAVDPADVVALLARPLDQFVAARTARAKELRSEGRRAEAAALSKVRKPVRLVWVVGELARRDPSAATAVADLAEEVEAAMAQGGGVRALLSRFRDVVGEVAGLADAIDGGADRLEVGLALREVLADPAARAAWLEGRLLALPGDEPSPAPPDELAERRAARARGRDRPDEGVHPSRRGPARKPPADGGHDGSEQAVPPADEVESTGTQREAAERTEALRRAEAAYAVAEEASRAASAERTAAEEAEDAVGRRQEEVQEAIAELEAEAAALREALTDARARTRAATEAETQAAEQEASALAELDAVRTAAGPSPRDAPRRRPRPRPGK